MHNVVHVRTSVQSLRSRNCLLVRRLFDKTGSCAVLAGYTTSEVSMSDRESRHRYRRPAAENNIRDRE